MLYNSLKIIHILSASLFLLSLFTCVHAWKTTPNVAAFMQKRTATLIIPLAIFQLLSGFTIISTQHYNLSELWIKISIFGFITVIASWFVFINTSQNSKMKRYNLLALGICIVTLLAMIFSMANKIP